jgi:hypothetical protein
MPDRDAAGGKVKLPPMRSISRRLFLSGGAAAIVSVGAECGTNPPQKSTTEPTSTPGHTTTKKPAPPESELATAGWLIAENRRPGTDAWVVTSDPIPHSIEGYPDHVSATIGDTVALHVSSTAPTFHVEAYRMGWYQGYFGRLVWKSAETHGSVQAIPGPSSGTNTVECNWPASLGFKVDSDWPPGNYLLKLVGSNGQQKLMPFIVRDDFEQVGDRRPELGNHVAGVQPLGPVQPLLRRGRIEPELRQPITGRLVRPPLRARGTGLGGRGRGLVGKRLPVCDVRGEAGPRRHVLVGPRLRCAASTFEGAQGPRQPGSRRVLVVVDARGCAVRTSGGCEFHVPRCERVLPAHPRREQPDQGPIARSICYKDPYEDPLYGVDNSEVTSDWPSGPEPRPECALIGNDVPVEPGQCVVRRVGAHGVGLGQDRDAKKGDSLQHVIGSEYDAYQPGLAGSPANLEIWAHSPLECRGQRGFADMTYYAQPDAGGVFATGTNWWVNKLSANTGKVTSGVVPDADTACHVDSRSA